MLKLFNIIFFSLCFTSCLFSFQNIEIYSNITPVFNDETIIVTTNIPLGTNSLSQLISIREEELLIDCQIQQENNKVIITPPDGWKTGKNYRFQFTGLVKTIDGRFYNINFSKYFVYKDGTTFFTMENILLPNTVEGSIIIEFNKPIDLFSFEKNFSISPFIETNKQLSEDKKTITIVPVKQWNYNTVYCCKLKELKSADNYFLISNINNLFSIPDCTIPELLEIEKCKIINLHSKDFQYFPINFTEHILNNILPEDALAFTFNTKIKLDSFKSNFSISPSIAGQFIESDNSIIYIPNEHFNAKEEYLITLGKNIKAENNNYMQASLKYIFKPFVKSLYIENIDINETQHIPFYQKIKNDSPITEVMVSHINKAYIEISFNEDIPEEFIYLFDKIIRFEPYFPLYQSSPHLLSIHFSNNNKTVSFEYDNLSTTDLNQSLYKLTVNFSVIPKSLSNELSMEDNICTILSLK